VVVAGGGDALRFKGLLKEEFAENKGEEKPRVEEGDRLFKRLVKLLKEEAAGLEDCLNEKGDGKSSFLMGLFVPTGVF